MPLKVTPRAIVVVRGQPSCDESEEEDDELVKPGDVNPYLGDIYHTILYQSPPTVIYINERVELRMAYPADASFPEGISAFEAEAVALQNQPVHDLDVAHRVAFMTLIGRAWVIVLEGAAPKEERLVSARKLLAQAKTYRSERVAERSREWFLTYAALDLFFLWLAGLVLWVVHGGVAEVWGPLAPVAINCFIAGATGAMVSICLRLGEIAVNPAAGWALHAKESAVRLFVGGMTAFAAFCFLRLGLIVLSSGTADPGLLALTIALFAGATERLFPSMARKLPLPSDDKEP